MNLFSKNEDNVFLSADGFLIKELNALHKKDKSKNKTSSSKLFAYIYHLTDAKSPYSNLPVDVKKQTIKEDIFNDPNWEEPREVTLALSKVSLLLKTPSKRLLESAEKGVEQIIKYFDNLDYMSDNFDVKQVADIMGKLNAITSSLQELKKKVELEDTSEEHVHGGGRFSILDE